MKNLTTQLSTLVTLMLVSIVSFAHEGMHAAGQTHVGENHMGLMEVALAVIALIAVGVWALKEVKSKK
jgi:hypothetical protein